MCPFITFRNNFACETASLLPAMAAPTLILTEVRFFCHFSRGCEWRNTLAPFSSPLLSAWPERTSCERERPVSEVLPPEEGSARPPGGQRGPPTHLSDDEGDHVHRLPVRRVEEVRQHAGGEVGEPLGAVEGVVDPLRAPPPVRNCRGKEGKSVKRVCGRWQRRPGHGSLLTGVRGCHRNGVGRAGRDGRVGKASAVVRRRRWRARC